MEGEGDEIKSKQDSKRDRTLKLEPSPFEPDKTRHNYLNGKCRAKNLRFFVLLIEGIQSFNKIALSDTRTGLKLLFGNKLQEKIMSWHCVETDELNIHTFLGAPEHSSTLHGVFFLGIPLGPIEL